MKGHMINAATPSPVVTDDLAPFLACVPPESRPSLHMLLDCLRRHDLGRTFAHCVGVGTLAGGCARLMGLDRRAVAETASVGLLHDVGKIGVDRSILLKPLALDPHEFADLRRHPVHSEQLLRRMPGIIAITRCVRAHHERWDGTGYPDRLQGEQIPLTARIVTVADAFDAMTRDRIYRPAMSSADAAAELRRCSGTMFDPGILDAFLDVVAHWPHLVGSKPEDLAEMAADLLAG
jgi:HD-GYP domain-containing protein (c-di-GMP phosphodiesterase class II)